MQNEVLVGRFGQLFTKLFGIRGANPVPQLSPEIQPVLDINEPPIESRWLMDVRTAAAALALGPGGAGNNAGVQLVNPVNSGVLITIEHVMLISAVNGIGAVKNAGGALITPPPANGVGFLDARIPGFPAGQFTGDNAQATAHWGTMVRFPGSGWWEPPVTLSPGRMFEMAADAANTAATFMIIWQERPIAPAELI